jgi:hypothetical protein
VKAAVHGFSTVLVLALAAACAHVEAPTGGADMRQPLTVTDVAPDTLAVVPGLRGPVVFSFERRLSERGLDDAVMVSPRTSPVSVSHSGRQLRVSLRGGWEPGRIYQVTVLPALQDLWNNRLEAPVTHVFSTGPAIPETRLQGLATDRITGRPEVNIRVEAIRAADSLVYATRTDSAGLFVLGRIPEGQYQVRAYRDMNRNREMEPFEPRDTAFVQLAADTAAEVRLRVVMPDTTPPQVASAALRQGNLEIRFDDHLEPEQALSPAQVRIIDPAGNLVAVRRLAVGRLDVERPAADTLPDAAPAPQPPAPAPAAPAPGGRAPAPQERLPSQTLIVEPAQPLAPETEYRIVVEGVRNVVGLVGGGETTFTTPAAPPAQPPADAPPPPSNR